MFIDVRVGQPVTHMRSTNSKPEPSNQLPFDKIKSRPIVFLVQEATIYVIIRKKKLLQLQFLADFMYYVITFSRFPANATKICRYDKPFSSFKAPVNVLLHRNCETSFGEDCGEGQDWSQCQ